MKREAGLIDNSFMHEHPFWLGAKTYLDYGFIGAGPNYWTRQYFERAKKLGTTIQIGFEPYVRVSPETLTELKRLKLLPGVFATHKNSADAIEFTLEQLRDALKWHGRRPADSTLPASVLFAGLHNQMYAGCVAWAKEVARHGAPVIIRPLSEMNEGVQRWKLTCPESKKLEKRAGDTAARASIFGDIWLSLQRIFKDNGATNAKFAFCPLAHTGNYTARERSGTKVTLEALRKLPAWSIDYVGINVYTTTYDTAEQRKANSFESLASGWMTWLEAATGYVPRQFIVGEMGIGQASSKTGKPIPEELRREWISDAFRAASEADFENVTYFNRDKWACRDTQTEKLLGDLIRGFQLT